MTTDSASTTEANRRDASALQRGVRRVRINVGALVGQDHSFGRWPGTKDGRDVDPDMEFIGEWNGRCWDCRADGFGMRSWLGEKGEYGNGSMSVHSFDGVTVLGDA